MYSVLVHIDLVFTVCINLNVIIYLVQFNNYINIVGRYGSLIFTLTIIDNYYSLVDFDNYTYNVLIIII